MASEWTIAIAIFLPLLGAGGILLAGRWPNLRESVTVATALATFGVVATLVGPVLAGEQPQWSLFEVLPGVALAFEVEPLGMLYALVASGLWVPTALYAIGYCRGHGEKNQTRFFACFALAIFAALGVVTRVGAKELLARSLRASEGSPVEQTTRVLLQAIQTPQAVRHRASLSLSLSLSLPEGRERTYNTLNVKPFTTTFQPIPPPGCNASPLPNSPHRFRRRRRGPAPPPATAASRSITIVPSAL